MNKLTEHFTVEEMLRSSYAKKNGIRNVPDTDNYYKVLFNLSRVCYQLEQIRTLLNKPIIINSAFRTREINKAVGGVYNSRHLTGCAADISLKNISENEIKKLKAWQSMNPDVREFVVRETYLHIAIDELSL